MKTRQWIAIATILAGSAAHAQTVVSNNGMTVINSGNVKDDLFAGTEQFEKNATNVTEITQGPKSLDMVNGKDEARAHRTILNVVRTYTYDKPGLYDMAAVDAYRTKLNTGGWECTVHERNLKSGSSTDVCDKPRTDGLKESAIITVSPQSLTFIHTIRKPGPGDQGDNGAPVAFMFNGPDLAMLDGKMALMRAKLGSADLDAKMKLLDGKMALMQATLQSVSPTLVVPRDHAPGDRDIIIDTDIDPPAPGNSFRMKVVAPPAEPAAPAAVPAPQP